MTVWHVDQLGHRLLQRFWDTNDDKERELIDQLLEYYKKRDSSGLTTTDIEIGEDSV